MEVMRVEFTEDELPFGDPEPTGRQLRDEGVALVDQTDEDWTERAEQALAELLNHGQAFTASDIVEMIGMPSHPNKVGAFVIGAARRKLIQPTGRVVQARRAASHARLMREWTAAG